MEEALGYGDPDGSVVVVGSDVRDAADLDSAGKKSKAYEAVTALYQDDQDKKLLLYGGLCLAGILLLLIINKK
jgi:hypothetical protein